jgi:hypothetical protein
VYQLPKDFKEYSTTGESLKAENLSPSMLSLLNNGLIIKVEYSAKFSKGKNHTSYHWYVEQALPSSYWHRYKL